MLRFVLGPLDDVMAAFFAQAGVKYDHKEAVRLARPQVAGRQGQRDYRVFMTAVKKVTSNTPAPDPGVPLEPKLLGASADE